MRFVNHNNSEQSTDDLKQDTPNEQIQSKTISEKIQETMIPKHKVSFLRKIIAFRQWVSQFWHFNSGEWHWLSDKPLTVKGLNRSLWRSSVPTMSFYTLLGLSAIIATFGLLANSAATIIGAMIVAPLMGPIIGMAYALVVGNRRLLKRSALTTFLGTTLCIFMSMAIALPLGFQNFGSEVLSRIRPSLLDMGVALAAGAAGSFAKSRRHVADALPGVAIAVALVPPLSVIGIGLSSANYRIAGGAGLLFLTNLIGIIFSGCLVFLVQKYGTVERAKTGLLAGVFSIVILGIPLGFSLRSILVRETVHRELISMLKRETLTFKQVNIESINTRSLSNNRLMVELEVTAKPNSISRKQIQLVRDFLSEKFNRTIVLKLKVIPAEFFEE